MRKILLTALASLVFTAFAHAAPSKRVTHALHAAFGNGHGFRMARCITVHESSGDPYAESATGDYGLLQINFRAWHGKVVSYSTRIRSVWIRLPYDLATFRRRAFDPAYNALVAWAISHGGRDWTPWSSYTVHGFCRSVY